MTRPMPTMPAVYPFAAIVGQDALRSALLMATVEPALGGVLAIGDRGTGKSTAIRALAALLPTMRTVDGCRYNCDPAADPALCPDRCRETGEAAVEERPVPVVDLPLGATEDRVVGALDLERALTRGEKAFEPGLLAKAHRGFLYIDEVNLLEDHLVDLLLDVAASGQNVVEREGLSVRHPARFVLIGSGNPEEGDLRPQLLDRFGLSVTVATPTDLKERIEVIRRRDAFESDPDAFLAAWADETETLKARLAGARRLLPSVTVPDAVLEKAAAICIALGTDGLRGELTLLRAMRAAAALDGRETATEADLRAVAAMALSHRLRRDPLDDAGSEVRVMRVVDEALGTAGEVPAEPAD